MRQEMTAKVVEIRKGPNTIAPIMIHARSGDGPEGLLIPWTDLVVIPKINSTVKIYADFIV